jgi:hypothetical protein
MAQRDPVVEWTLIAALASSLSRVGYDSQSQLNIAETLPQETQF